MTEYPCIGTTFDELIGGEYSVRVRPVNSSVDEGWYGTLSAPLTVKVLSAPENLKYNASSARITWSAVTGASGYMVEINGAEYKSLTTSYAFESPKESFDVRVKATTNSATVYDSAYSASVSYTYLAPVTDFSVKDGVLYWGATENATAYLVKLNNSSGYVTVQTNCYNNFPAGESVSISIKPIIEGANTFSSWSVGQSVTLLASPANLRYEAGQVLWDSVSSCGGYTLKISKDGAAAESTVIGESTLFYDVSEKVSEVGTYTVQVAANADDQASNCFGSKLSSTLTIKRLAAPTNLTVTDNSYASNSTVLTYSRVTDAVSYMIKYSGVDASKNTSVTSTTVNISDAVLSFLSSVQTEITVIAKGTATQTGTTASPVILDSKGAIKSVTKLATPTGVRISNNKLYFDSVSGADGYIVYVDGTSSDNGRDISTSGAMFSVSLNAGVHTIALRAKGNGSDIISSNLSQNNDSTPLTVRKLATPTVSIANEILTLGSQDSNASSYMLYTGDAATKNQLAGYTTATSVFDAVTSTTTATVFYAKALGNGELILDSEYSSGQSVLKLAAPTNFRLADSTLQWNSVAGASTYAIYESNIAISNASSITTNSFDANLFGYKVNELTNSEYTVNVVAKGNGSTRFTSDISATTLTFTKLARPNLTKPDGEYYVWAAVNSASGYTLKFGSSSVVSVDSTVLKYKPVFPGTGSLKVSARAIGNNTTTISSSYTELTQTVVSLTVPEISASYDNGLKIFVTNTSAFASCNEYFKYSYSSNGTLVADQTGNTANLGANAGTYGVLCTADGEYFQEGTFYVSACASSASNYTVLAAPTDTELSKDNATQSSPYYFNWRVVAAASSYSGTITLKNASGGVVRTLNISDKSGKITLGVLYSDDAAQKVTSVTYTIKATGNGSTTFESAATAGTLTVNY